MNVLEIKNENNILVEEQEPKLQKKDKEYWKAYNEKRKEYLKQKKRESRVKLKSLVVDRKEKNQVVDQTKNIEVVDLPEKELVVDEQVVDISKVVDQKNSMSTTEEIVDKKNNVEPLKVSQVEQKIEPGLVEQLNQQILELKEQLAQEKEEKANWTTAYVQAVRAQQELNQKLQRLYSAKFAEKAREYVIDLVNKHIALTKKQHFYQPVENRERDFLDEWTNKWWGRDWGNSYN